MKEITISTDEYKNLIKTQARVEVFAEFVNASRFSIGREECAKFLGFEIEKEDILDVREPNVD